MLIAGQDLRWGVTWAGGGWTAWCPAVTVQAATAPELRALIEQAITGEDPERDEPA